MQVSSSEGNLVLRFCHSSICVHNNTLRWKSGPSTVNTNGRRNEVRLLISTLHKTKRIEPSVVWLYPVQDWWKTVNEVSDFMSTG